MNSMQYTRKKIVIADDDPAILDAINMLLTDEGYKVETTSNGDTVRMIRDELPDLLLLDIWMSGVDGRDICRYLKTQTHTKHIPIIMISAGRDAKLSAERAGADDFIPKPFEADYLLEIIKKHLSN